MDLVLGELDEDLLESGPGDAVVEHERRLLL
jgi:hypothetical protein